MILLHLSGDRKSAIAVSIPRDTIITLPTCKEKGKKVGGIEIPDKTEEIEAVFALFMEKDLRVKVTADPRTVKAFI